MDALQVFLVKHPGRLWVYEIRAGADGIYRWPEAEVIQIQHGQYLLAVEVLIILNQMITATGS